MRIFWYAPFNNAGELDTAREVAKVRGLSLTVESIGERFGRPLPSTEHGNLELVRDLPAPSGEGGRRRSRFDRARVAIERAIRRHRLVKRGGFDLVHLHTFNAVTDWIAIPLLKRHCPVVIQSVHNVRPHDSVLPKPIESAVLRVGYRSCSAVIVAHGLLGDLLVGEFGVRPDRVSVVPFALTMPILPTRDYGDRAGPVKFLVFGTMRNNKGIDVLIEALDGLDPGAADVEIGIHIAGRGEERLERAATELSERKEFVTAEIGFIEDDRRRLLYAEADCVLLPYTELQAQSGVLHDAYASRLPVIASDVRALGTAVQCDRTGWTIPPGDAMALRREILKVAVSADERRRRGEAAGKRAEASTTEAVASKLLELYATLAAPATRC